MNSNFIGGPNDAVKRAIIEELRVPGHILRCFPMLHDREDAFDEEDYRNSFETTYRAVTLGLGNVGTVQTDLNFPPADLTPLGGQVDVVFLDSSKGIKPARTDNADYLFIENDLVKSAFLALQNTPIRALIIFANMYPLIRNPLSDLKRAKGKKSTEGLNFTFFRLGEAGFLLMSKADSANQLTSGLRDVLLLSSPDFDYEDDAERQCVCVQTLEP